MEQVNFVLIAQGLFGLCTFVMIGWLLSENREKIKYFSALTGIGVQILCALITTRIEWVRAVLICLRLYLVVLVLTLLILHAFFQPVAFLINRLHVL